MDLLSIFDGSKPFKKISVPLASHRRCNPTDMSALDNQINEMHNSTMSSGIEYTYDYIKEEEERTIAEAHSSQMFHGEEGGDETFEKVSLGTFVPTHHDLFNEGLTKIYNTYSFDHRPKHSLTISTVENKIISMIETNPVTVIQGPTGCGKTTQVPQFILDSCHKKRVHCNIIVTQPRRIAAISITKRVSQERNWPVGTLVGFQVGMVNNTSQDTRLTYCTTGVLLHKLISMKSMHKYTHVIIDEIHERDQDMDLLLLVVRKLLRSNSRAVKVILMSATFNIDKFSNYFSMPVGKKLIPAPVVDVTKSNFFKIRVYYLCHISTLGAIPEVSIDEPKVTQAMMNFCQRILYILDDVDDRTVHRHAVLIFLPGIWEIEEMHNLLTSKDQETLKWDVVVLHSTITNEEQQHVFDLPPTGFRRIILATNIAESSITMPDIKYVIDFCLTKQLVTDPQSNLQCLETVWASKANCEQRAGRTGRLMDGRVYRLVPQRFYEQIMLDEAVPEMMRAPLETVVLKTKLLDMGEPKALLALALDPPDLNNLERTILLLKEAGGLLNKSDEEITPLDGELTDLGRIMAALPLDIRISKLIALGQVFSVLRETIIIGASMAVKNMFSAPFQKKLQAYTAKLAWASYSNSDCISFLNVYNRWMIEKANRNMKSDLAEKRWARRQFLQIRVLREIDALVHEVTSRLRNLGITETLGPNRVVWKKDEKPLILKIVIAGAFYPNFYTRSVNPEDEREGLKILGGRDPTKTVYLQGWPVDQPGPLYARRIKDYFQDCVSSEVAKILVTFDQSSRVYVQFHKNEAPEEGATENTDEPGEISLSVYKAVKLRMIGNNPIEIPIIPVHLANDTADKLRLQRVTYNLLSRQASDVEIKRPNVELRPVLPGLDISCIPIIIHRVITPGHFWAQTKDEENAAKLREIDSLIEAQDFTKTWDAEAGAPAIGSLVLAPREGMDNVVYARALVQNVSMASKTAMLVKVLFVDFGYVSHVPVRDIFAVEENSEICRTPALAFECVLAGIRPATTRYVANQWSQEASDAFHKLLLGAVSIYGKVFSVVNSIVHLELVLVDGSEQLDVNKRLVKLGHAERKEEDYLSRYNHDLRENHITMPVKERQHHEELQYEQSFLSDCYPEPPPLEDCTLRASLRGPYSPLEISLGSLINAGVGKRIHVDSSSVNSVLLDADPEDPHDRLMVAGSVNQNVTGRALTLRNTTLMPNIPGLTSLLCLLFAPKMELRRNSSGTRYIGALCGLGCNPSTNCSFFPEHDLSIYFDVDISMVDLEDINRLRHWMSLCIHVDPHNEANCNQDEIAFCQNRIKDVLFMVLNKSRKPIAREFDSNFEFWCRYDKSSFIPPGTVAKMKQHIFRLHSALRLEEKNDSRDAMILHIMELRESLMKHYRDSSIKEVHCKLCDVKVFGVFQLRIHVNTEAHKSKEKQYHPLPQPL